MDIAPEKLAVDAPRVSVLMVTYNRVGYIREAVESVLRQSYRDLELVIVDDGSTDDTEHILRNVNDSRIRYVRLEKNSGVSAARNRALSEARGKYLAVLDSDDVWIRDDKLSLQVAALDAHPEVVVIGTFITIIDSTGVTTGSDKYETGDQAIRAVMLCRNQFAHSSVVTRADAVQAAGGYGNPLSGEDYDLFLRLGEKGQFANIPEYMTAYRIHDDGISKNRMKVARALHGIIWKYRHDYPHAVPAMLKNYLRFVRAAISTR